MESKIIDIILFSASCIVYGNARQRVPVIRRHTHGPYLQTTQTKFYHSWDFLQQPIPFNIISSYLPIWYELIFDNTNTSLVWNTVNASDWFQRWSTCTLCDRIDQLENKNLGMQIGADWVTNHVHPKLSALTATWSVSGVQPLTHVQTCCSHRSWTVRSTTTMSTIRSAGIVQRDLQGSLWSTVCSDSVSTHWASWWGEQPSWHTPAVYIPVATATGVQGPLLLLLLLLSTTTKYYYCTVSTASSLNTTVWTTANVCDTGSAQRIFNIHNAILNY